MRIWDLDPKHLCRQHLLAEHRELHAIWSIIVNGKKGYSKHPETTRWRGKLSALYRRHGQLQKEMSKRNYHHYSPLDCKNAIGKRTQNAYVDAVLKQKRLLRDKPCACFNK